MTDTPVTRFIILLIVLLVFIYIIRELILSFKRDRERFKKWKEEKEKRRLKGEQPKTIRDYMIGTFANVAFLFFCLLMGYIIAENTLLSVISPFVGAVIGFGFWLLMIFKKE